MKWILGILFWVVGMLLNSAGDFEGSFEQMLFSLMGVCFFIFAGTLLGEAAREYWKKKRDPDK